MPMKLWSILAFSVGLSLACRDGARRARNIAIELVAESDPGARLPGVRVHVDGKPVGVTGTDGSLEFRVRSSPDRLLKIEHDCPPAYLPPSRVKHLRLRPLGGLQSSDFVALQVTLECRPEKRLAVFIVRAQNGPNLPVKLDGRVAAETSSSGVAHLFVSGTPGSEHSIEIDTMQQPPLMPRSPVHHFTLPDAHEVFVVNQSFEVRPAASRTRSRRARILKIE